jgi:hypothetical protein
MADWLYEQITRVPEITDAQIAEMRHILPVLAVPNSSMYQLVRGADALDPRSVSFLWDAQPEGEEFTFHILNMTTVITQHHSAVFFKPSLAEVYAWIRFYLGDNWASVSHFCMGESQRIGSCTDVMCWCELLGGPQLVRGAAAPSGHSAYELVPRNDASLRGVVTNSPLCD